MFHRNTLTIAALFVAVVVALLLAPAFAQEEEEEKKPRYTVEQVMEMLKEEKLVIKAAKGEASDDEKKRLLDLSVVLMENKPPQGELDSWLKFTSEAVAGAARVVVGREGAERQLRLSFNCMGCHKVHKPKKAD